MDIDEDKIDEAALALMYLTLYCLSYIDITGQPRGQPSWTTA